jgi:micrococcal nuclease
VVDGDTIIVQLPDGERERVRLIGIDTPESVDPRRPVECLGEEAAKRTQELLAGRRVLLAFDPTQGLRDRYRRLLAYVFRDDGLFVNETLIAEGYAHEYTYATPYTYQAQFKRVQQEAREEQRGLWHPSACANFPKQNERRP